MGNFMEGSWCIGGDINEVLLQLEKSGRRRPTHHMVNFNEWVSGFKLIELPLKQIDYTWSNQGGNPSFRKLNLML